MLTNTRSMSADLTQIIHNPGTTIDSRLEVPLTDITVVFEESYSKYQSQQSTLDALSEDRFQYSYMIHSIPWSTKIGKLLDKITHHSGYIFLSYQSKNYYESFGSKWKDFVDAMPKA